MRVILQRTLEASVSIDGKTISSIGRGFLILVGIEANDDLSDAEWLAGKIAKMRVFNDSEGKMNRSLAEIDGEILLVSQFTLHASTKKGNRPSFLKAARPEHSEPLYERFCSLMEKEIGKPVAKGVFGGDMKVALVNDGPVTIFMDSKARE